MNRIDATFAGLRAAGRTALIPYVTTGDPSLAATLPILQALMAYANPIEAMGVTAFADRAQVAGVDGVIVVDYPPEEAGPFAALLDARGIAPIFLLSPTTPASRIATVGAVARGYVYYVSLKGVTGASHLDTADVIAKLAEIRRHVALPIGV